MVLVPAVGGWSAGKALRPSASPSATGSPSVLPTPSWLGATPSAEGPVAVTSGMPIPSSSLPPPIGWKLSDVPQFPPPPAPEPIVLPPGDKVPFLSRVPVTQPVAFLTIDDGWTKRPEALELLRESGVKVTLFLTINAIKDNPDYFKQLRDAGAEIQAHTLTHPNLKGKSYDFQRHEICGSADQLNNLYGKRPTLFRPPFGDKDATTLKVAHDCGLQAGFFWKETVDKGIVRYQEGKAVKPGDIILMHFRDRFVDDFIAALQAISAAGLTPALLTDYMPAPQGH
jgi:peptidoglycan/xylan/chitin deacetylase (PgdA/CDA1 family)